VITFRPIEPGSDKGGGQRVFSSACGGKEPTAAFDFVRSVRLAGTAVTPWAVNCKGRPDFTTVSVTASGQAIRLLPMAGVIGEPTFVTQGRQGRGDRAAQTARRVAPLPLFARPASDTTADRAAASAGLI
jgi:hypothetical protein